MKITIAGGSGFLGKILINHWRSSPYEIVVLTRSSKKDAGNVRYIQWDAKTLGKWTNEVDTSDVIINLVGRSVNCRYTKRNKEEIINSRVDATHVIGKAIFNSTTPPKVWINAGSAAIFGNSGDEEKNENSPVGEGFSPEVCKRWEKAFHEVSTPETRKVFLRIGLVLQPGEGLLKPFINLARLGVGGKIGSGEQYISWIHEKDFVNIVELSVSRNDIEGIIHCTSPLPIKNKVFMKALRTACNIPFGLPNPAPLIHLGALFIGTEGDLVLEGRRVVSKILKEKRYEFSYPNIDEAMKQLLK